MKLFCFLPVLLLTCQLSHAQDTTSTDAGKTKNDSRVFTSVEQIPEFPGGYQAFSNYLAKNLQYPKVARLIGVNGKLLVSFTVDEGGHVINATPRNCVGAGCEAEAVRLLEASPVWRPAIQNGRPVRVQFNVPISFSLGGAPATTYIGNLRNSKYGFVFNIKGVLYTIDEAEKILGRSFPSDQIEVAEPFYNYNKVEKFEMPDKKEVYLIILKKS
ncbi:energy transducer TonB [Mucilaginibacter gotjawali]|uniref:TonB family protein n=2 Tax=Mucilaginibacter gotjawali TaxID=1550579 RepID=A0A839SNX1_9SPHI|nr:energy transducer TonB [Mucilaginibacter gotjawali]MBB3059073.1 TonB family protein [Mucilaginibacter gotjawali]BAU52854.1 Gram-negative bacterial tonB protein [Mucilaginibacter gotjawali]